MDKRDEKLWEGIDRAARDALSVRDYRSASYAQELAQRGVDAGELVAADRNRREIKEAWILGVEIFARKVFPQRHRGCFTEFVRRDEGILARIGLWPKQWSAARMFGHTAKGFHVHPPSVPEAGAAALLGIGRENVRHLAVDESFRMRVDDLVEKINADLASDYIPFCVVANAGTVDTGAVDCYARFERSQTASSFGCT